MKSKREVLSQSTSRKQKKNPQILSSYLEKSEKSPPKYKTCRENQLMSEESIEIKIPTPYPQNHYMLIEDEALMNSRYTHILNE